MLIQILLILVVLALWLGVGILACLFVESREPFHKLYDPFGLVAQVLILLLWPLALLVLTWRRRHARFAR